MAKKDRNDKDLVTDRHPEHIGHEVRWRWLMDSLEGGDRYRDSTYGTDTRGQAVYNLVRHKREYPEPRDLAVARSLGYADASYAGMGGYQGSDPTVRSTDDDFELRRARTPIPTFVAEAIDTHLGVIYSKEIGRKGIDGPGFRALRDWMEDVDGRGTRYDQWIRESFAPLFLVLGQLDLYFDHPRKPDGAEVATEADVKALGLDRCIVSYVLPENVRDWSLDPITGLYAECVVRECVDPDDPEEGDRFWHWTPTDSRALDKQGNVVVDPNPHPFGCVPVVRLFDRRKFRCRNVGQSRYEGIAERQREYYNRDSELILSDTTQAHPLLQGPEDYVQADGSLPIGPGWLLPKKKNSTGAGATYEGFDVVDFPKDGAESIRKNKADIRDDVDRDAALAKPAGAAGSGAGVVGQSGLSKIMDSQTGNRKLSAIANALARCERTIVEYALRVLLDRPDVSDMMAAVEVVYPTDYDLQSSQDLGAFIADFMDLLEQAGNAPESEIIALSRYYRAALPGLDDEVYRRVDEEIREHVEAAAERKKQLAEAPPMPPPGAQASPPLTPANPDDLTAEESESGDDSRDGNPPAPVR
jgi:hypothetical protein